MCGGGSTSSPSATSANNHVSRRRMATPTNNRLPHPFLTSPGATGGHRRPRRMLAYDVPPPIASPCSASANPGSDEDEQQSWKPRRCRFVSSQRLATLQVGNHSTASDDGETETSYAGKSFSGTCPPLFLSTEPKSPSSSVNDCLVAATTQGELALWSFPLNHKFLLDSLDDDISLDLRAISPTTMLALDNDAPIVALSSISDDNKSSSRFAALSLEGDVHILQIIPPQQQEHSTEEDQKERSSLRIDVLASFYSGLCGATCFSVEANTRDPKSSDDSSWNVIIGYDSGVMEAWVFSLGKDLSKSNTEENSKMNQSLNWRGLIDGRIQALAHLKVMPHHNAQIAGQTTDETSREEDTDANLKRGPETSRDENDNPMHSQGASDQSKPEPTSTGAAEKVLVVTHMDLQEATSSNGTSSAPSSSSMVDVLNLLTIQQAWESQVMESTERSSHGEGSFVALPLQDFWILPAPGLGVMDAETIPYDESEQLPRRPHSIQNHGSSTISNLENGQACGVALSDGITAILKAFQLDDGTVAWGVIHDHQETLLSFHAITCSSLLIPQTKCVDQHLSSGKEAFVVCLRGGTVVALPVENNVQEKEDLDISVIPFPSELDSDISTRPHLQTFASSMVPTSTQDRHVPALAYVFPSGIIELYSFGLISHDCSLRGADTPLDNTRVSYTDRVVLAEMIRNGSVKMLCETLEALQESDELLEQTVWNSAWVDYKTSNFSDATKLNFEDIQTLSSESLSTFRRLLLSLATDETEQAGMKILLDTRDMR